MKRILSDVLDEIRPLKEDEKEIKKDIDLLLNKINKNLKDANAILGGSGIKGTWLRKANDADIFVRFNYNKYMEKSQEISNILEKILKRNKLKIIRLHGSRDYFQIKAKDFTYELIPILDIKKADQAINITDISPLHADWVNKKGKKFKDDIRLTKQFCKSAGIYGAESYIQGFSGYICEILTIHYKGFPNLMKNAAKWKDQTIIDTENYWKGKNILMELNRSKTISPLIMIDPVQNSRNAAAALSDDKFNLFRKRAKAFLKKPSKIFFEIKEIDEKTLKKNAKNNELILIDIKPKKGKQDVIGCKLVKALEFIDKKLEKNDFKIINLGWKWNKKVLLYFTIKKEALSKTIEREGPPVKTKMHVANFKEKYKKTYIKNKRIYSKVKREFMDPKELIKSLKKEKYLKEKIISFDIR